MTLTLHRVLNLLPLDHVAYLYIEGFLKENLHLKIDLKERMYVYLNYDIIKNIIKKFTMSISYLANQLLGHSENIHNVHVLQGVLYLSNSSIVTLHVC